MSHCILLVDDEPNVLSAFKRNMAAEKFRILTAGSAKEGLRVLEQNRVDVVVSDHDMPGMNGNEFLHRVCVLHPSTVRFILTGKATLEMAIQAVNNGQIHRFLSKPCNAAVLAASIRDALQQRELLAETRRLLWKTRVQESLLEEVEREHPGITHLKRESDGAILLEEIPTDMESLLQELAGSHAPLTDRSR